MKTPSPIEAITLAAIDRAARIDSRRAAAWAAADMVSRERALSLAGLERDRAADPLTSFSVHEIDRMRLAIMRHVAHMEFLSSCLAGGSFGLLH